MTKQRHPTGFVVISRHIVCGFYAIAGLPARKKSNGPDRDKAKAAPSLAAENLCYTYTKGGVPKWLRERSAKPVNDRNLVLSYSHRKLLNDPDSPVPARVRAPLACLRERASRQPSEKPDWPGTRFLGRTVSDLPVRVRTQTGNAQLCQPEPGPKIRLDIYPQLE